MVAKKNKYQTPLSEELDLLYDAVLCASPLTYGDDQEPGKDPGWDDEFNF